MRFTNGPNLTVQKKMTLAGAALLMTLALGSPLAGRAEPIPVTEGASSTEPMLVGSAEEQQLYSRNLMIPLAVQNEADTTVDLTKRGLTVQFMIFSLDPSWANLCVDGTTNPGTLILFSSLN